MNRLRESLQSFEKRTYPEVAMPNRIAAEAATRASFDEAVGGIAQARYAIRKVLRIVDDQARNAGIDPLHHQALIQIHGSENRLLHVTALADRLDVPAALASRLVSTLEKRDLVRRQRSTADLRMIEVHVTESGVELLRAIYAAIGRELGHFSLELSESDKLAALGIMAKYVGLRIDGNIITIPEEN